jgi:phosphocarrier protein
VKRSITVANENGLHLRVASALIKLAREFDLPIHLERDDNHRQASSESILELITLGAIPGSHLTLTIEGAAAEELARKVEDLFVDGAGI